MKKIINTLIFVFPFVCISQLTTVNVNSPIELVEQVFLAYGIDVSNVVYTGSTESIGTFQYTGNKFNINQGIILTNGNITSAIGPNNSQGTGSDNGFQGSALLDNILPLNSPLTLNASILEFDFISQGDSIFFNYSFGSEEYLEYVNAGFNDVFGLFISGPGIVGIKNIATLDNGSIVSIDNVNNFSNNNYFIDNGDGLTSPFNSNSSYIQYDGFTISLEAKSEVTPGAIYHLTFAIADVSDGILDSGIFLEAQSLKSNITNKIKNNNLEISKIGINPNPSSNFISFKIPNNKEIKVTISNVNGINIKSNLLLKNNESIDINFLDNGIYFALIELENQLIVKQFVKK